MTHLNRRIRLLDGVVSAFVMIIECIIYRFSHTIDIQYRHVEAIVTPESFACSNLEPSKL